MAITNKSKEWERKNSLYVLLGLFPFLNSLAYFHMNSRVPNPKTKKRGWLTLFVYIFIFVGFIISAVFFDATVAEVPSSPSVPSSYDYFGAYLTDEEKVTHENYEEYSKAYKEWEDEYDAWDKSEEVVSARARNRDFHNSIWMIVGGLSIVSFVFTIITLFDLISSRADFLRALAQVEDRGQLASRLGPQAQSSAPSAANIPPAAPQYQPPVNAQYQPQANAQYQPPVNTQYQPQVPNTQYQPPMQNAQNVQAGNPNALDLNSATEEQLTALPGLTVIDAKKAIEYRTEHGGFSSKDEFFNAISIKPHIMVRIDPLVYTGAVTQTEAKSVNHGSGRRTIDF